jgi:hypothetical protein
MIGSEPRGGAVSEASPTLTALENQQSPMIDLRSQITNSRLSLLLYRCHQCLRGGPGGSWILSRDQQAIADHVNPPVGYLRKDGAQFQHLIFDKERHHLGETHLFLFAVSEAGNFLSLSQKPAVRRLDAMQRPCGVAHDTDRLAGSNEGLDQSDGILVFGEIPHRAMAAGVEDGVEVFLLDGVEANGLAELSFRGCILLVPDGELSTGFGFVTLGIQRRPAAFA